MLVTMDYFGGAHIMIADFELLFSIAGMIAMVGWLTLLFSPLIPNFSDKVGGMIIPVILSAGYAILALAPAAQSSGGGFGTLAEVMQLFTMEQSALAGWVHFLAFDLFIGGWICRTARADKIPFWLALPCLPLTFMLGPIGLLAFWTIRLIKTKRSGPHPASI